MLGCFPIFFLWNPPWACAVVEAYGVAANLPFIIVQRYNRAGLLRISSRPDRAGIDPLNKLIDRDADDNETDVTKQ
jgi:hypothetical protein